MVQWKIVLLFYMDDCLIFSTSRDNIHAVYVYLNTYIKIEYDGYLNKFIDIELDHLPDG